MKNKLTNLQTYELYKWIDENRDLAKGRTAKELAVTAEAVLEFTITENNMDNARRESGIVMRPVVVRDEGGNTTGADIIVLTRAIADLYNLTEYICPRQIVEIINR